MCVGVIVNFPLFPPLNLSLSYLNLIYHVTFLEPSRFDEGVIIINNQEIIQRAICDHFYRLCSAIVSFVVFVMFSIFEEEMAPY